MGNESSTPVAEDVPPVTLYGRTIEAVADYIKKNNVRKVVVMNGAGISTSAGIPDFRSPDTGLYANLARLNLPYAEAVFDISYFRNNPRPFYELAHEMHPGKYRPTITHSFVSLLHQKGMLLKAFTQNIDCLERKAGVPGEKIVEAHGSFATQRCIDCGLEYPEEKMKEAVAIKEVPYCEKTRCGGLVKPDIVFFGEALPESFHRNRSLPAQADLAIVMGTSLTVQPFASLPSFVREETPRILINRERAGGLGSRPDDVVLLGDCDEGVRKLADALGWREELEELWESTNPHKGEKKEHDVKPKDKQTELDDKIDELTRGVDKTLKLSEDHQKQFEKDFSRRDDTGKLAVPGGLARSITKAENQKQGNAQVNESGPTKDDLSHVYPHIGSKSADKSSL
ncbi:Sir2 histone deacetylase Hst2 [Exophiala xenobiotica]|uniref:NAD-dependent protein deacetylase n=1 Tax=Lithohypha guttulata TaxID=1690604 RepID=A0ABR0KCN0_9EURO|nr:Sir2 histone deacetylase Hst2 [Lithohypha guttulata]KAK5320313.1 Sir2 histone deacetylase Hst2 [Exophiala xenobiotica]